MTLAASRRTKWRAASRPRPVLLPVMMMVWPVYFLVGYGGMEKSWERRNAMGDCMSGILAVCCWDCTTVLTNVYVFAVDVKGKD